MLHTYFSKSLPLMTRRLLAMAFTSSIAGKAYSVDGMGLDISMCIADDDKVVMRNIVALREDIEGMAHRLQSAAEVSTNSLATKTAEGSLVLMTTLKYMRANDMNAGRRRFFKGAYDNSGPGNSFIYEESGRRYALPSPSISPMVLDNFERIRSYISKQKDDHFDRMVMCLERADLDVVASERPLVPSAAVVQYFAQLQGISSALEASGRHIDVEWLTTARLHFDEQMDKRWEDKDAKMSVGAYKKVKKLCALIAVMRNMAAPEVLVKDVDEALAYLTHEDAMRMLDDNVEAKRIERKETVFKKACEYLDNDYLVVAARNTKESLHGLGIVGRAYLLNACQGLASFNKAPGMSRKEAVEQAVSDLVAEGRFVLLPWNHLLTRNGPRAKGRIFSDLFYVNGYALERIHEWQDANPEHSSRAPVEVAAL